MNADTPNTRTDEAAIQFQLVDLKIDYRIHVSRDLLCPHDPLTWPENMKCQTLA